MLPISILTQNEWDELYSRSDYEGFTNKDPNIPEATRDRISRSVVEYLIALSQPDETIMGIVKQHPATLRSRANKFKFRPLHLAVLKGRFTLVRAFLEAGANTQRADIYGWLPVHHAALISAKMFALIAKQTTTPCPLAMRQQLGAERICWSKAGVEGKTEAFEYSDLPRSWEAGPIDTSFMQGAPPQVLIKDGVFAKELLDFERPLFPLNSEVASPKKNLIEAMTEAKSPRKVGNVACFINDGFPNCMVSGGIVQVIKETGIQKGEELFLDLGFNEWHLKWNTLYRIGNKEEMRAFVQNKNGCKTDAEKAKLHYCYYTPAAILDLWCTGIITGKGWKQEIKKPTRFINVFLSVLERIETKLATQPKLEKAMKTYIARLEGKRTILEISEMLLRIIELLSQQNVNWSTAMSQLTNDVTHDPQRDIRKLRIAQAYLASQQS